MKKLWKNYLAGIGRMLGQITVVVALIILLKLLNIDIDFTTFPPSLEGEITKTLIK